MEDLRELEAQLRQMNDILIRHVSEINEWRRSVDKYIATSQEKNTRAPVLLFAAISALSGLIYGAINLAMHFWGQ